ncbi:binding-protein-dependent transport systems inner membrane component [Beutenbergia cavernae DSM 12333]|uniref:Binding-protein-dependent transport systems inner membrane component n=1 Tax=Beutenbergia cavernae (strain ATCC BAA-8 / DSM 12333 / CCUG 43141 / JCM 11478 / NBRC 16432 / NCIMB 13614 / HKI 0122) TaxID=471853 RepID=C5BXN2_BEUC1|nr:ABC transporter permease subunit [Beutenbergia cavernae]ACQ80915.1 binding-protein-dependent transport systems inner membrane component [Beutenbergia cavernae DSM 12333]
MNPAEVARDAVTWLNDPVNWTGPQGVLALTGVHLQMTLIAVLAAAAIALPLGTWLGHTGRGGGVVVAFSNVTRAMPTYALLILFSMSPIGRGNPATVIAVAIFAIPPMLSNAYVGVRGADADAKDAARGVGMSPASVLGRVELPLAVPLIAAGARTSAVQTIATIPIAALAGGQNLGTLITTGFATQNYGKAIAGAILVIGLCLVCEAVLAVAQRVLTPPPLRLAEAAAA